MILDTCIIGAGPAGLQAAEILHKAGLSVKVLERGAVGQFFRDYPRQRNLISINKVHTGLSDPEARLRYDWNSLLSEDGPLFTSYSRKYFPGADLYVSYLEDFAKRHADRIETGVQVTRIAREGDGYVVETACGQSIKANQVIVATGVTKPWHPGDIEGFDLAEDYFDFDPTPSRFRDKRVLILGKGNSAFETAESLIDEAQTIHVMSPNPIKFAWNTHFVGHLRAVNTNFLDTYQLKSQNAVIDARPERIERAGDALRVTARMQAAEGHEIVLDYDHVVSCTGFRYDNTILDEAIRPGLHRFDKFPQMGNDWSCPDAPGLWFAGTITQSLDFKKTMSGFVHGFRHNISALCDFVIARAKGTELSTDNVDLTDLAPELVRRASTSAAMFLQPGFLGDVIGLNGPQAGQRWSDMPVAWARDTLLPEGEWLTATLEFGDFGATPLHVHRRHDAAGDNPDPFIHPVLRHWRDGEVVATIHLTDHLDSDWRPQEDRDPGTGTVRRMTFADRGAALPPGEVALDQARRFLDAQGIGTRIAAAAE